MKGVKEMNEKVYKATEEQIGNILREGINAGNLNLLYQLIDIQKDICEIERSDSMHYGNYDSYGARMRDSRGRFMERGYDTRYRGHDYLDEMYANYGRYEEGRGSYNRGNYGAKEETLHSLEFMLKSVVDFVHMLKEEAVSPEETNLIHKYLQKLDK